VVRHSFPQTATGETATNSNFPPQSGGENTSSPVGGTMQYQDFETMEYENLDDMDYESGAIIPVPADWLDDENFKSRIPLTIEPAQVINGPETDFQMLVNSTFSEMANLVQSDGRDIRFAGTDKVVLPYEIESITSTSGNITAWLKVPSIDTGKIIYMYFNNPGASDAQSPASVWNVNNIAVWHLNQTTFGANSTIDSTGDTANNFTPIGGPSLAPIAGKIDGALDFDGVDDMSQGAGSTALRTLSNDFTITAWIKPTVFGQPLPPRVLGTNPRGVAFGVSSATLLRYTSVNVLDYSGTVPTISTTNFSHIAVKLDGNNNATFYKDGVNEDTDAGVNPALPTLGTYNIGSLVTSEFWDGVIDELRVYSTALSDDKITTIFNNENDPGEPGNAGFYKIDPITNI